MSYMGKSLVVTVIGDPNVGKTSMLVRFAKKKFNEKTLPTIFDKIVKKWYHKGATYDLTLCDTAGQEDFENIQSFQFQKTDVFLACFATDKMETFESIERQWIPKVKHYDDNIPIVLVGTKADLPKQVGEDDVEKMRKRIRFYTYVPCSAKTAINVNDVFSNAIEACTQKNKRKLCSIF